MPKLPANFVKAPSFDNPLRATGAAEQITSTARKLVLRIDESTWALLEAACKREGATPEALVGRALELFLNEPARPAAMAPREVEAPRSSLRTQLLEQLHDQ
ncbi:MAG TPA: hypothetical protein VJR89_43415, partial [Polyangiales bacterium]|nr:hypothetical protein [Polyangiales bacterium]